MPLTNVQADGSGLKLVRNTPIAFLETRAYLSHLVHMVHVQHCYDPVHSCSTVLELRQ